MDERPMAARFTSTRAARGPAHWSRYGKLEGQAPDRARPRVRSGDKASRASAPSVCRRTHPHVARSKSRRRHHGCDAGRPDRPIVRKQQRYRDRSQPTPAGRKRRSRQPSTRRSVPGFAPSVRSGRSEGIFVGAAASANPPKPDFLTNHHGSSESRLLTPARRPIGRKTANFCC